MKKLILTTALILLASQNGYGFSIFEAIKDRTAIGEVESSDCPNFSGSWKGSCTYKGKSEDSAIKVSQAGCYLVNINQETIAVGGLATETITFPYPEGAVATSFGTTADWEGQKLKVEFAGTVRDIGKAAAVPVVGSGELYFDDVQLMMGLQVFDEKTVCAYDKEQ